MLRYLQNINLLGRTEVIFKSILKMLCDSVSECMCVCGRVRECVCVCVLCAVFAGLLLSLSVAISARSSSSSLSLP